MSGEVTMTEASGLFAKVYDKIQDLRPKSAVCQRRIEFEKGEKQLGESFNVPVELTPPNGFTYIGASGAITALKQARNMQIKQATLQGYEINLREQIAYKVLASAVKAGPGAFKSATAAITMGMQNAVSNRVEGTILHGQRGYGTVESVADGGSSTVLVTFTATTWAPGLWWAYGPGSTWDAFTSTTKNNGTAALVLVSINAATRTVKFSHGGTFSNEVAAGDVFYPEAAYDGTTHLDAAGLLAQASNTTGTSLGLSATTYTNWAGNTYAVSGPAGYGIIEDALSYVRDRGVESMLSVLVSGRLYSQLAVELASVRNLDASYSAEKGKQGIKAVQYFSPEVGDVEVVYHPFMKWGEALIIPFDECVRVGSSDVTFGIPGMDREFFTLVNGYNAVEMQNFTDQAPCLKKPNHSMVLTGITY